MKHGSKKSGQSSEPDYRNVQAELWQLLDNDQKEIVARTFCHLKNHVQIEVAEALIDVLAANIYPDPRDWSCAFADLVFTFINQRFSLSNQQSL